MSITRDASVGKYVDKSGRMWKREVYYTDGDWSVRLYEESGVVQFCHTHPNGRTWIIPFGYSRDAGYKCHECYEKAPLAAIVIWTFLNWDRFSL